MGHIIWIIIIGFVAGMLARWFSSAPNTPSGFIFTVLLGIAGAFLATFIGQSVGWYRLDQGAGLTQLSSNRQAACQSTSELQAMISLRSSRAFLPRARPKQTFS